MACVFSSKSGLVRVCLGLDLCWFEFFCVRLSFGLVFWYFCIILVFFSIEGPKSGKGSILGFL